MASTSDKIPLVYILSCGRSGSTLLELLLGKHPNTWALGEVHLFPWAVNHNELCGCRRPIAQCPFWCALLDQAYDTPGSPSDLQFFRRRDNQGKTLRWSKLPGVLGLAMLPGEAAAARLYGERNQRFLSRVLGQVVACEPECDVRWLVDSSKSVYRLHWLEASGLFDIRVIHLVKDPRAFVYSMSDVNAALTHLPRYTARWLVENALAHRLCQRQFPGRHLTVLYEELATSPLAVLSRIGRLLDLQFTASMVEHFRNQQSHGIAGNAMRDRSDPVRLDVRWRTGLTPLQQQAIWLASAPTRRFVLPGYDGAMAG